jgi:hypothetical protein
MAITKEVLDELLKGCKRPDDFYGHDDLVKQSNKAFIERMMQAELTEQLGCEKSESGEKPSDNRRNGKSSKTLRTDQVVQQCQEIAISGRELADYRVSVYAETGRYGRGEVKTICKKNRAVV